MADTIDAVVAGWRAARPDLDPTPLAAVGRVLVLAGHLARGAEEALSRHGLTLGQFDILATLRRHEEGGLTPGQLLHSIVLTSGGMTGRLDRLEQQGLVKRSPDPGDRRGVIVQLTAKGRRAIDAATDTRFAQAAEAAGSITEKDAEQLERVLRKWLAVFEEEKDRG
jgi:DNA-binding MarR family transcriptional regulator